MASLSTCHLGLWIGWQILLNLDMVVSIPETKIEAITEIVKKSRVWGREDLF